MRRILNLEARSEFGLLCAVPNDRAIGSASEQEVKRIDQD